MNGYFNIVTNKAWLLWKKEMQAHADWYKMMTQLHINGPKMEALNMKLTFIQVQSLQQKPKLGPLGSA